MQPLSPQQKAWDAARASISAEDNEKALEEAMREWAEMREEEDDALLDEGFGVFSMATPEQRKGAFLSRTDSRDIWRVLLNPDYEQEFRDGIVMPPYSPFWAVIIEVGGWHVYNRFAREFRRAWNSAAKDAGLDDLVYSSSRRELPEVEY